MAISRSQMRRQLSNRGGITNLSPRQNFGLGSKLKRAVRKIIPNEVSKVATAAAPFVAPFNPALAGAMAGIGSFDQTGSLSDAFKSGALTYGGGQAARYIGGAGFQGNPFASGGAFTPAGFTAGFSSPVGTETGLGKFFNKPNAPISEVQGIDPEAAKAISTDIAETGMELRDLTMAGQPVGGADPGTFVSPLEYKQFSPTISTDVVDSVKENVFQRIIKDPSVENIGKEALNAAKKAGKAIFYDKDGNLDKNVLLGTIAFAATYAEAKGLADDVGVDLTESEYDEARKAEKKEQYASNLQNFFAGKKEGGRIGFQDGTLNVEALMENIKKYPEKVNEITDFEVGIFEPSEPTDQGPFIRFDKEKEEAEMLKEILRELEADGGRIGLREGTGSKKKYGTGIMSGVKEIDPLQQGLGELKAGGGGLPMGFTRLEKSFLFKHLAKLGGADRSFTMPQLYRILSDPSKYPKDAMMLKEFLKVKGFSKGGDVGSVNEIPVRKNKAGVEELDMRASGGFVPIGVKEKADDVPAMLSKNEFVLTADAVRGIGGGSVEKGSEKLYNLMKTAEQVGKA
jgi:hypothetical protein